MRIALCFSGQCRISDYYKKFYIKNFLAPILANDHIVDTFFHFWSNGSRKGVLFPELVGDHLDGVIDFLQPKAFVVEPQITNFEEANMSSLSFASKSMFYSIREVNRLKKKYEIENNFVYDCVFRIRTDIKYNCQFDCKKELTELNRLHLRYLRLINKKNLMYNDHLAFSNSLNMDRYADCYSYLSTLNKSGPEEVLSEYVNNILGDIEVVGIDPELFWW